MKSWPAAILVENLIAFPRAASRNGKRVPRRAQLSHLHRVIVSRCGGKNHCDHHAISHIQMKFAVQLLYQRVYQLQAEALTVTKRRRI